MILQKARHCKDYIKLRRSFMNIKTKSMQLTKESMSCNKLPAKATKKPRKTKRIFARKLTKALKKV